MATYLNGVQITEAPYYTELDGADTHVQVANNAWENWDMSGFLPAGSRYAEIKYSAPADVNAGVRAAGSALARAPFSEQYGMFPLVEIIGGIVQTLALTGHTFACLGVWRV